MAWSINNVTLDYGPIEFDFMPQRDTANSSLINGTPSETTKLKDNASRTMTWSIATESLAAKINALTEYTIYTFTESLIGTTYNIIIINKSVRGLGTLASGEIFYEISISFKKVA